LGEEEKRSAPPRGRVVSTLALAFMLGVAAALPILVFYYQTHPSVVTSTSTTEIRMTQTQYYFPSAAASNVSQQGLQLELSLNSTSISAGRALEIEAFLLNALPTENAVNTAIDWMPRGIPLAVWPVCDFEMPFEFLVLKGNYSLAQLRISDGMELQYVCTETASVDTVTFMPNSYAANLTLTGGPTSTTWKDGPYAIAAHFSIAGYWDPINQTEAGQDPSPVISPPQGAPDSGFEYPQTFALAQHLFVPGIYTVAVSDEWGDAVLLHFQVT
jgi:hypothetical protein